MSARSLQLCPFKGGSSSTVTRFQDEARLQDTEPRTGSAFCRRAGLTLLASSCACLLLFGFVEQVKALLDAGASVDDLTAPRIRTALCTSAYRTDGEARGTGPAFDKPHQRHHQCGHRRKQLTPLMCAIDLGYRMLSNKDLVMQREQMSNSAR